MDIGKVIEIGTRVIEVPPIPTYNPAREPARPVETPQAPVRREREKVPS
jgi:hypothetical protein